VLSGGSCQGVGDPYCQTASASRRTRFRVSARHGFRAAAVNIASQRGACVIATTRREQRFATLRSIGATDTLLERTDLGICVRKLLPEGVDAALDLVETSTVLDTLTAVRPDGHVCMAGFLGGGTGVRFRSNPGCAPLAGEWRDQRQDRRNSLIASDPPDDQMLAPTGHQETSGSRKRVSVSSHSRHPSGRAGPHGRRGPGEAGREASGHPGAADCRSNAKYREADGHSGEHTVSHAYDSAVKNAQDRWNKWFGH
jgi:hypothetical protein